MRRLPRNGFALLLTLWLLVPIALFFLVLVGQARSSGEITSNLRVAAILGAAADGGIETAIAVLLASPSAPVPPRVTIGASTVGLAVEPLSGLLNPNLAPLELLRALLIRVGAPPARAEMLAGGIIEWRTPGQARRNGGSKAAEYRADGRDYGPPGTPFETISELGDVIGMTPQLLATLRPNLSLFSDRLPAQALAPPLLQAALRDAGVGGRAPADAGTVFEVTGSATGQSGAIVQRRAVVRLSPGARSWRILAWETVP